MVIEVEMASNTVMLALVNQMMHHAYRDYILNLCFFHFSLFLLEKLIIRGDQLEKEIPFISFKPQFMSRATDKDLVATNHVGH